MKFPKLQKIGRYTVCILLVAAVLLVYEARLFQWQIIEGEAFVQESLSNRTDVIELGAARGQIFDKDGNVLAGNRTTYNIVYNALEMDYSQRNATIMKVIDILEERGEKWRDRLPIYIDEEGNYQFKEEQESEIENLKSQDMLGLAEYATADDCMKALAEKYSCVGYSNEDARNVASVRYSMTRDGFSRTNPYVIAEDVSDETVGIISQRSGELKGIEPRVAVARYYGEDGSVAPHIVGTVGAISAEQYQAAVENGQAYDSEENVSGYKWTDSIGRGGIEQAFEAELRGKRGQENIYTDDTGQVTSTAVTVSPQEGNSVYLTLDSELQRVANLSLAKNIRGNVEARDCVAGAAVVIDVKTFGVLASASYPNYDLNLFTTDNDYYNLLVEDEDSPLFNRALNGVFTPGSIFKPMVALAALQEGVITDGTTVYCGEDRFTLADLFLDCTTGYGDFNVYNALSGSCNTYFATVGMYLTIRKMDAYAEYFGLGEHTGIELAESTGIMSNPQEYEENHPGEIWLDGATAQTAIGQADNMFTPIQLATYCATIANGGVRLQTHFLDKVTDYTGEQVLESFEPVELYDAGISPGVQSIVREGMLMATRSGTASDVFSGYPVAVAGKTGTAETTGNPNLPGATQANISFICYAPADDPQIAVAVMLEHGHKGAYAKRVAKDILDAYFGFYSWDEEGNRYDSYGNMVDDKGEVVKTAEEIAQEKGTAPDLDEPQDTDDGDDADETGAAGGSTPEPTATPEPLRGDIPSVPFDIDGPAPSETPDVPKEPDGPTPTPNSGAGSHSPYYSRR